MAGWRPTDALPAEALPLLLDPLFLIGRTGGAVGRRIAASSTLRPVGTLVAVVLAASANGEAFKVTVPAGYVELGPDSEARSFIEAGGTYLVANATPALVRGVIAVEPTPAQAGVELSSLRACAEIAILKARSAHAVMRSSKVVRTPLGKGCQVELLRNKRTARRVLLLPLSATQQLFVSCHLLRPKPRVRLTRARRWLGR